MLKKEDIISKRKKNYKPTFLLAWAKFLNYSELEKTDNLEVYDRYGCNNANDWNKQVLEYSDDNLKHAICIALDIAMRDIKLNNGLCYKIYFDDIKEWLKIIENKEIQYPKKHNKEEIYNFYNSICDFYGFNIKYES